MRAVSSADVTYKTVVGDMGNGRVHEYLGKAGKVVDGPQGFLVDMLDAHSRIDPHFHDVDQFQVVVKGDGRLGRHQLRPIALHYADAYSPYGPIIANEHGLSYFTLRPFSASGYWLMPGSKDKMRGKPGRNLSVGFALGAAAVECRAALREAIWSRHADGMLATGLRLGPDASAEGEPSDAGGQYILVCAGSLSYDGKSLPPMSLLYIEPGEARPTLTAGSDGAELVIMQFPQPSERPGSSPRPQGAKVDYQLPAHTTID